MPDTIEAARESADTIADRASTPLMVTGRFSRLDEVADAVLYLASEQAANITGADIRIDGGMVTT